jgi:hypothetical protein
VQAPDAVRATITLTLDQAAHYPGLLEASAPRLAIVASTLRDHVVADGMEVAGCRVEPERDQPFAKPRLPDDPGEGPPMTVQARP